MGWDIIAFNCSAFIAGLFLLEFGADVFIDNTAIVARRLGISETLVALLTAGAEWEEVIFFSPILKAAADDSSSQSSSQRSSKINPASP